MSILAVEAVVVVLQPSIERLVVCDAMAIVPAPFTVAAMTTPSAWFAAGETSAAVIVTVSLAAPPVPAPLRVQTLLPAL